jgi:hypothetical protein
VPKAGGAAEEVATLEYPTGIVAGADGLFVIARLDAWLARFELDGTGLTEWTFWPGDNTMRLAGGPTHLVWSDNSNGKLMAVPRAGGPKLVVAEGAATMDGEVAVGADVIVVAPGRWDFDRRVVAYPLQGGTSAVVGDPGEGCGAMVALVGGMVVWSRCDGAIVATALPGAVRNL